MCSADLLEWPEGVRGEITMVVAGATPTTAGPGGSRRGGGEAEEEGSTRKDAIAEVAKRLGLPRREVYEEVHRGQS